MHTRINIGGMSLSDESRCMYRCVMSHFIRMRHVSFHTYASSHLPSRECYCVPMYEHNNSCRPRAPIKRVTSRLWMRHVSFRMHAPSYLPSRECYCVYMYKHTNSCRPRVPFKWVTSRLWMRHVSSRMFYLQSRERRCVHMYEHTINHLYSLIR